MKKVFSFLITMTVCGFLSAQQKDYSFTAVPFTSVHITDNFWLPRLKTNHTVTIPASFERCEKTGRIKNFEMAAAKSGKFCTIFPFDDTDIYKTIEGASYSLSIFPDKKLELYIDSLIDKVAKAQEPDGYLYTARTIDPLHPHDWSGTNRWEKERDMSHELYNSGHLYEAAAAHFIATGKRNLFSIALKNADLVCAVFGKDKLHVAPGHQVVEMGLVKLYRLTGKKEYLETAKFFIEERGHYKGYNPKDRDVFKNGSYWQDNIPVADQREAMGHAVRAGYLYAAVADVAALTGDRAFLNAIDSIWENLVSKKLYVQGGAGAIPFGERYGENYELPNGTAYNETCAAIANVYWNQRMFQLHGESKYVDVLEKILYNGLISGVGLDGKSFFYTNAMQVKNYFHHHSLEEQRSGWFDCSCCPTNVTRLLPSVPGYMYAQKDNDVFINLFINSNASLKIGEALVDIEQQNNYPWEGDLKFIVSPKKKALTFALKVRIPGWAVNEAIPSGLYSFVSSPNKAIVITVNGQPATYTTEKGYAILNRSWKKNDVVEMKLPMEVQRVKSHDKLADNKGKVALQRGPLIYCTEWADNNGLTSNIILPSTASFTASFNPSLLNGVMLLTSEAKAIVVSEDEVKTITQPFTAIPYYAWANRGKGEMTVWIPENIQYADIISK